MGALMKCWLGGSAVQERSRWVSGKVQVCPGSLMPSQVGQDDLKDDVITSQDAGICHDDGIPYRSFPYFSTFCVEAGLFQFLRTEDILSNSWLVKSMPCYFVICITLCLLGIKYQSINQSINQNGRDSKIAALYIIYPFKLKRDSSATNYLRLKNFQ